MVEARERSDEVEQAGRADRDQDRHDAARGDRDDARMFAEAAVELDGYEFHNTRRTFDDGSAPARLHGDLWAGNLLWTADGGVLIDPAAHGGHRETDLAMLALFGLLLAVLCLLLMLTEGAMADWGGLYLRQDLGASAVRTVGARPARMADGNANAFTVRGTR